MEELLLFVGLPILSTIVIGIKNLDVVELFSLNLSKVLINLHLPLREQISLGKTLNQITNAAIPIIWLCDHISAKLSHLVSVLGEICRKAGFVASRRN